MAAKKQIKLTREDIAKREIGHTDISPRLAAAMVGTFLFIVFAVPIGQTVYELCRDEPIQAFGIVRELPTVQEAFHETDGPVFQKILRTNARLLQSINEYEDSLEEHSLLTRTLLGPTQAMMLRALGHGNEKAYLGRDRWLFFRPGIDTLSGPPFLARFHREKRAAGGNEYTPPPQPNPLRAILDFQAQLAERDIQLLVVPVPVKPTIHPEQFSARFDGCDHPVQNPSFGQFKKELEAAGVLVYDPAPLLVRRKQASGEPQFLQADTHWTPAAMDAVAEDLSELIQDRAGIQRGRRAYERREQTVSNLGDIASMLNLADDQTVFPRQTVTVRPVGNELLWTPQTDSEILVLGDSFSNIYSLGPMGWGEGAGFVEQLSYHLQRPLDRIVQNDAGSHATRRILSRELAAGRDRLAGKKLVVWQFATRELSLGDWELLGMDVGAEQASELFSPEAGTSVVVSGKILEKSPVPRPDSVPYRDHIFSLILGDLRRRGDEPVDGMAYIQMWSMRDRVRTPASRSRTGQRITVRLQNWQDVADKYDPINKSLPANPNYEFEIPCWAEEIKQ